MVAAFAAGRWSERREAERRNEWAEARLLSSAVDSVRVHALDSLPSAELIRRAVSGMLRELHDPYAALLRPDGYERYRGSLLGEGKGLGLQLRRGPHGVSVAAVVPGSPAASSGIRPGDRILAVDGVSTASDGWGAQADSTAAAPAQHLLTVWRALRGDTVPVVVPRRVWHAPAVAEQGLLSDSVAYVRLATMSASAADELEAAVEAQVARGAQSLLLDLRGNTGGLFEEGVKAAGLFLPRGAVVASLAGRGGEAPQPHRVRRSRWLTLPLTVLVDANTASAAEVIAAALRDYDRALLVGSPTYGKGLVQRVVRLSPDLSLRLTTARWLTPKGVALERRQGRGDSARGGLVPDVVLDEARRRDVALAPSGWPTPTTVAMDQLADSLAVHAVRDGWTMRPLALLEARMQAAMAQMTPRPMRDPVARAEWVAETMRMATVRVLEVEQHAEALLRYRARHDAALRAGLDILEPGTAVVTAVPTVLPPLVERRALTMP
jgi:carboxyl-terminal processing protease